MQTIDVMKRMNQYEFIAKFENTISVTCDPLNWKLINFTLEPENQNDSQRNIFLICFR